MAVVCAIWESILCGILSSGKDTNQMLVCYVSSGQNGTKDNAMIVYECVKVLMCYKHGAPLMQAAQH